MQSDESGKAANPAEFASHRYYADAKIAEKRIAELEAQLVQPKIFIVTAEWPNISGADEYIVFADDHKNAQAQVKALYHSGLPQFSSRILDLSQPNLISQEEE